MILIFALIASTITVKDTVFGTWGADTVFVESTCVVPTDSELTIMSGTRVIFQRSYSKVIVDSNARLTAQGDSIDSIIFEPESDTIQYQTFYFYKAKDASFKYCRFYKGNNTINAEYTPIEFLYCNFVENIWTPLSFTSCDSVIIKYSEFINNDTSSIVELDNCSYVEIDSSLFNDNHAYNSGVIFGSSVHYFVVKNNDFLNNIGQDGALRINNCDTVLVTNNYFYEGESTDNGGFCDVGNTTYIEFNSNSFKKGTAASYGGAICILNPTDALLIDNEFVENSASWGGAICANQNCNVELRRCVFYNNEGTDGGAIYAANFAKVLIDSCVFGYNEASVGGVVYIGWSAKLFANRSMFCDNGANDEQSGLAYIRSDADTLGIASSNVYANLYQFVPAIRNLGTINIPLENNYWGYLEPTKVDSIILGSADFTPIESTLVQEAPGEPDTVTDFAIYKQEDDTLYVRITGQSHVNYIREFAVIIAKSDVYPDGIGVALFELDKDIGMYEGKIALQHAQAGQNIYNDDMNQILRVNPWGSEVELVWHANSSIKISDTVKVDNTPPDIRSTTLWGDTNYTGPFEVYSWIEDDYGVAGVFLFYRADTTLDFIPVEMENVGFNRYWAEIPAQPFGGIVQYYVKALDIAHNESYDPSDAPNSYYSFTVSGIKEVEFNRAPQVNLMNPQMNQLVVRYHLPQACKVKFTVYDLSGRTIYEKIKHVESGTHVLSIDALVSGIYYVRMDCKGFNYTNKVVILGTK